MNAKQQILAAFLLIFLVSCVQGGLVLPEMNDAENEIITLVRKQKVRGIAYHHASIENNDVIFIVSYPVWSQKQVELLGQVALENAQPIFSQYPFVEQCSFYAANGTQDPEKKHFLTLTRPMWNNPSVTISQGPIMAYEIAQNYYVGTKVKGTLGFMRANEYVALPLQKPMP
ncbi:MAG: hypothetical protein ACRCVN_07305 [Spirochaetia bacterium]